MNEDFKLLVNNNAGLNDSFSALSYYIDFFYRNKLQLSNLHFSTTYGDLNQYLTFKKIKYLEKPELNDYTFIGKYSNARDTNLNSNNEFHISNFIEIKNDIKDNIQTYPDHVAVHFRFMNLESNKEYINSELKFYLDCFQKIYNKFERYLIFSDSNIINLYFENFENDNIILLTPDTTINHSTAGKQKTRKNYLYKTICDLYTMSKCKTIYKTKGGFVNSACIFNKKIIIQKL